MIRNYFKIAWRNLIRDKAYSAINIGGLALGLAVSIIISIYVYKEYSYDSFHVNYEKIYRVLRIGSQGDDNYLIGYTSGPYAQALKNDFPENIKDIVRVSPNEGLLTYKNNSYLEKKVFLADRNFFEIFSFPLQKGSAETVLEHPNSIVLTQEMAKKYFGNDDPMGKTLQLDNELDLTVTGIMEEIPSNSHLDFDFITSIELLNNFEWFNDWWSNSLFTYAVINSPEQAAIVKAGCTTFMDKYFAKDFEKNGNRIDLTLQPLAETYFEKNVRYDNIINGDKTVVNIFSIIAIFILLIAAINFTNLTTARSSRRAKEIGVRKVLGAVRSKLIWQFLTESMVLVFISILIAVAMVSFLLPLFNNYFDLQLAVNFLEPQIVFFLLVFALALTFIAGTYPAFLLSSFQPVKVLKGGLSKASDSIFVRKGLVVFQFAISFFLIAATLLIANQFEFIQNKDKGFNEESVVLINLNNSDIRQESTTFKNRLKVEPDITNVSILSGEPGGFHDTYSHSIEGLAQNQRLRTVFADIDYTTTFGLQIVAGRDFSIDFSTDETTAVLVNETAVKSFGWTKEEALGKELTNTMVEDYGTRKIIGVIKDYHFSSLKDKIDPLIITAEPFSSLMAVKLRTNNLQQTLSKIEQQWSEIAPAFPIEFTFLENDLANLYRKEELESRLFIIFSIISILIACLGSFALAAYSAEERIKEIGIRKILGSSVLKIFFLLTKDFAKIVLFATVITTPIVYYFMNKWLQNFAYRIEIHWSLFVVAGLTTLIIAFVTVSFKSIKAAKANPINSLKTE